MKNFNFPTGFAATAFLYTLKNLRYDMTKLEILYFLWEINVAKGEGGNISIAQGQLASRCGH